MRLLRLVSELQEWPTLDGLVDHVRRRSLEFILDGYGEGSAEEGLALIWAGVVTMAQGPRLKSHPAFAVMDAFSRAMDDGDEARSTALHQEFERRWGWCTKEVTHQATLLHFLFSPPSNCKCVCTCFEADR